MFCSAADITQQGRQEVAQRLIHFNARNSIFKLSLNGHHCKPDWQASKQDHTVRLETQQKSFALRSELKHLFLLPLSWQYFLFELRHTHTHTCCYLIWKSLLEVLLQQPPLRTIFIYTPGWNPWDTKHSKAESTKGQMAEGHICLKMWSFLASDAFFSTEWLMLLTVSRSYWPARLIKLTLFHVEVYTQHFLYWMWHIAMPSCSQESKSFSCPSDSPHLCRTSGAHSSGCII